MKTRSIFLLTLFAVIALIFLGNCSGNQKDDRASGSHDGHPAHDNGHASGTPAAEKASEPQFQVDKRFQEQMASVFTSYVDLKDALVSSDPGSAKEEAADADQALGEVDMKLLSGAAHHDWMNFQEPMEKSLQEIQGASDIEAQRKAFSGLTDNLYKSIRAFGLGGDEAYYGYCPMAFNNEGGYWLSDEQKIRNPYFGDKMLTCGEVKEKLK